MIRSDDVGILKTLASETRMKVIELLLSTPEGLRFTDIAKALDIYPSTLEDHLKRLVNRKLLLHVEDRYLANMNAELASRAIMQLAPIVDEPYFATHKLTVEHPELKERFHSLTYTIYHDVLSVLSKAKDTFDAGIERGFFGGTMDMRLEEGFFELWNPTFKNARVEGIFTKQGIEDLKKLRHPEIFIDAVEPSRIELYLVDDCDFALGGSDQGGFLFLPTYDGTVDFTSCLCFESPEGVMWLQEVFDDLRARSKRIDFKELFG